MRHDTTLGLFVATWIKNEKNTKPEIEYTPIQGQQSSFNVGGRWIVISFWMALASMFMNWTHFLTYSQKGVFSIYFCLLIFWLYPLLMTWMNKPLNIAWGSRLAIINIVITAIFLFSASRHVVMFHEVNAAGSGGVLYFFASIILYFGVIGYRQSELITASPETIVTDISRF